MPVNELAALGCAIAALAVLLLWCRRARIKSSERASLPQELRDAELAFAEQVFRAETPVPIVAKPDRGYRNRHGVIILVELKTRHANRAYLSDLIELSAQKLAVEAQTGDRVADHGYVFVERPGRRLKTPHRVSLPGNAEIIALAKRREDILDGLARAEYASSPGLCKKCAFRKECGPPDL